MQKEEVLSVINQLEQEWKQEVEDIRKMCEGDPERFKQTYENARYDYQNEIDFLQNMLDNPAAD